MEGAHVNVDLYSSSLVDRFSRRPSLYHFCSMGLLFT